MTDSLSGHQGIFMPLLILAMVLVVVFCSGSGDGLVRMLFDGLGDSDGDTRNSLLRRG